MRCPSCGGADVRHSLQRGIVDSFMKAIGRTPYRCRRCERRFYRRVDATAREAETGPRGREG